MRKIRLVSKEATRQYHEPFKSENDRKDGIWELWDVRENYFFVRSDDEKIGFWKCSFKLFSFYYDTQAYSDDILPKELFEI